VRMEKAGLAKPTEVPGVVLSGENAQYRGIHVPAHRFTPLKLVWEDFARPIVQSLKLQVRCSSSAQLRRVFGVRL
jgi:hypothetical protein